MTDSSSVAPTLVEGVATLRTGDDEAMPTIERDHYTIDHELARGGMGRIFLARDRRLGRNVAVKEVLGGEVAFLARFDREVRLTARLQHPGIVSIYEAGKWPSGEPFYAMRLVEGRPLEDVIRETRTLRDRLALLPHVLAVAEALAYAHGQRIIHRDLKPANVLVGKFGETVVIDWGLAKDLDDATPEAAMAAWRDTGEGALTMMGSVMGTPSYMPLEQATGKYVDARADVYAIGAILYEVLAGKPPYEGPTGMSILGKLVSEAPVPIRKREPGVPADLVAIVERATARDAAARYPTAKELADDLRRYQTGQLVATHTYSTRDLIKRWLRRHRTAVAVAGVALIALVGAGVASYLAVSRERDRATSSAALAEAGRLRAEAAEGKSSVRADELAISHARATLYKDPTASLRALANLSQGSRAWGAARMLASDARSRGIAWRVFTHGDYAEVVDFSRDGTHLATRDADGTYLWDVAASTVVRFPHGLAALSPTGDRIAIADREGVQLWDTATHAARALNMPDAAAITALRFTPDGERLIVLGAGLTVWRLADLTRADLKLQIADAEHRRSFVVSADGSLAAISTGAAIDACVLATSRCTSIPIGAGEPMTLAASPDGKAIACAVGKQIFTIDVASGTVRPFAQGTEVTAMSYADDGRMLGVVGVGGGVALWRLVDHVAVPADLPQSATWLRVVDDHTFVAAVGNDVVVTDLERGSRTLRGHTDQVTIAVTHDGKRIASASEDGSVRVWDREAALPDPCGLDVRVAAISRDHRSAAAIDHGLRICDLATGTVRHVDVALAPATKTVGAIDGKQVALVEDGKLIVVTDGARRELGATDATQLAFLPIGLVAIGEGSIAVWDLATATSRVLVALATPRVITISPDGHHVLDQPGPNEDGTPPPVLRDLVTGKPIALDGAAGAFGFSPDGHSLAMTVGAPDGSLHVRILAVDTGATRELAGKTSQGVMDLLWSPDDKTLASYNVPVELWDLATGKVRVALHAKGRGGVRDLTYSPDGRRIAVLTLDGVVHLIDVATTQERVLGTIDADTADRVIYWPNDQLIFGVDARGAHGFRDDLPADPPALHAWLDQATSTTHL